MAKPAFNYGVRAAQMFDKYRKKGNSNPNFRPSAKLDTSQVEDLRGKRSPRIEFRPRPKPQKRIFKKGNYPDLGGGK